MEQFFIEKFQKAGSKWRFKKKIHLYPILDFLWYKSKINVAKHEKKSKWLTFKTIYFLLCCLKFS
jgi:hypothetical protein